MNKINVYCSIICEKNVTPISTIVEQLYILWGTPYLAQKLDDCRAAYMSGIRKPFFPYGKEGKKNQRFC